MKKNPFAVAISLFAVLMLLPVIGSVNNAPGKLLALNTPSRVDGNPIPPLPPQLLDSGVIFLADGNPIPPMPPHGKTSSSVLAADGNPIPPMPPHFRTGKLEV